jgi:transposase
VTNRQDCSVTRCCHSVVWPRGCAHFRSPREERDRFQKTLEGANIKLSCVAGDLLGVSARQMLAGLCAGQSDPTALALLARGRLREKLDALEQALEGQFGAHPQFLVARQLADRLA